jgi:hypothetical protein
MADAIKWTLIADQSLTPALFSEYRVEGVKTRWPRLLAVAD